MGRRPGGTGRKIGGGAEETGPDQVIVAEITFDDSARVKVLFNGPRVFRIELSGIPRFPVKGLRSTASPEIGNSINILADYLLGRSCNLHLIPVVLSGLSEFSSRVLTVLHKTTGCGETITYGELAMRVGTGSPRAVGQAMRRNPIPIVIPCHRVVSRNGIGGYSAGLHWKKFLLKLERSIVGTL